MFDVRRVDSRYVDVKFHYDSVELDIGFMDKGRAIGLAEELLDAVDELLYSVNYDWNEDSEDIKERLKELVR